MTQKLDFILKKKPSENQPSERSVRRLPIEKIIPILILLGFSFVMLILFGERLIPSKAVTVIPVFTTQAEDHTRSISTNASSEQNPLFQASGWFESDPYSFRAVALTNGIIQEVKVLEGEMVQKNQVIATLVPDDAKLDLQTARLHHAQLTAEHEASRIDVEIVHSELATLEAQIHVEMAKLSELQDTAERMIQLADGAVPMQEVIQAKLKLETGKAALAVQESNRNQLQLKIQKLIQKKDAIHAKTQTAETDVKRKLLALQRTNIISPIDGIIQSLHAAPGQKKVLGSDHPESVTIATLYQPEKLQARIDVPLEEASKLQRGQAVIIQSNFLQNVRFKGVVTRIVGESDIQRNTLQVKVEIRNPDARLRPEMLCRAEFYPVPGSGNKTSSGSSLYLPASAILELRNNQAVVFKLNRSRDRIQRMTVTIDPQLKDGYYPIQTGLLPGDQLVKNPTDVLKDNQRIHLQP